MILLALGAGVRNDFVHGLNFHAQSDSAGNLFTRCMLKLYMLCVPAFTKMYLVHGWNNKLGCKLMYFIECY